MMKRRDFLKLLPALMLAACATPELPAGTPDISFMHLPPIGLSVGAIDVASGYDKPMARPNVEHLLATSPETAALRWGHERLQARGGSARAEVKILDASVVETLIPKQEGKLMVEATARYDARLQVSLKIDTAPGGDHGEALVTATRSQTVLEDATLAEREQAQFEMVEKLMHDFDVEMERQIRIHLDRWVVR